MTVKQNNPTLKIGRGGGYRLYWPTTGGELNVPKLEPMADGNYEFESDGRTFMLSGLPHNWTGKEIKVEMEEIERRI
jgi:hypothetical protein